MVSWPEMSRIVNDFELCQELLKKSQNGERIGSTRFPSPRATARGSNHIPEASEIIVQHHWRNGKPLFRAEWRFACIRYIMDSRIVETVRTIGKVGKEQYQEFVAKRLEERKTQLFDPIKRKKLPLFGSPPLSKQKSQEKMHIASLKSNCSLYSRLYVSCQARDGNLEGFFCHENQSFPPSLSQYGQLRSGTKSDLLSCLEKICPAQAEMPNVDALLLDGAEILHMQKPGASKTFQEYSQYVFLPYVIGKLRNIRRVDVVWDRYLPNSLKATTQSKRGRSVRRRVMLNTRIPGNWSAFT